jgi:hypothetical protein
MPQNLKKSNAAANAEADALAALLNTGYLRIYDGTQPATADTAITTQNLLAELTFSNPAFPAAIAGVLTANSINNDTDANRTGTASWFRCFKSDGVTPVMDGSIGTSGCDMNLASTSIQIHAQVSISSFVHTVTK